MKQEAQDTSNSATKTNMNCPPHALSCNGHVKIRDHIVEMTNTCTVDNMLYSFHMLKMYRADIHASLANSSDQILRLSEIHSLFNCGMFMAARTHSSLRNLESM